MTLFSFALLSILIFSPVTADAKPDICPKQIPFTDKEMELSLSASFAQLRKIAEQAVGFTFKKKEKSKQSESGITLPYIQYEALRIYCLSLLDPSYVELSKKLPEFMRNLHFFGKDKISKKSLHETVWSGRSFYVVLDQDTPSEQDCKKPEVHSPAGDFLIGAAYQVQYNTYGNVFFTKGPNHGKSGCPYEFSPDARPGSDKKLRRMILWGILFEYNLKGEFFQIIKDKGKIKIGHIYYQ